MSTQVVADVNRKQFDPLWAFRAILQVLIGQIFATELNFFGKCPVCMSCVMGVRLSGIAGENVRQLWLAHGAGVTWADVVNVLCSCPFE